MIHWLRRSWRHLFGPGEPALPHFADDAVARLAPSNPAWSDAFADERGRIESTLGDIGAMIDHVGSTSIKTLVAKPYIDILVTLRFWSDHGRAVSVLQAAGYSLVDAPCSEERAFLTRDAGGRDSCDGFHLHLVGPGSSYGERMLIFRDAIAEGEALRYRYRDLKIELAEQHQHDLASYTEGKSDFVERVLRDEAGALGIDRLLSHQRAELDRSQRLHFLVVALQIALALLAAGSVIVAIDRILLDFAVIGFVLVLLWAGLAHIQRQRRSAGDAARRAALICSGLGKSLVREQRLRIFDEFKTPVKKTVREEDYFASRAGPGYPRLAELIQESAFWTRDVQRASATALLVFIVFVLVCTGALAWQHMPWLTPGNQFTFGRILIAALVFLFSSDVIGAMLAHRETAHTLEAILNRTEAAAARGYPETEILLLLADYNGAVEGSPVTVPLVYRLLSRKLAQRWRAYRAAAMG